MTKEDKRRKIVVSVLYTLGFLMAVPFIKYAYVLDSKALIYMIISIILCGIGKRIENIYGSIQEV